jgi:WXG100 protein secretion system (Wss), protein YukD
MPQITVTVVRADTNQEYEVELPDNAKLEDLLPQLVQQLGLPLVGPDGNRISYQLSNKRTSQELKQNHTLAEYSTKNGDMLLLTSTFVAGRHFHVLRTYHPQELVFAKTDSKGGATTRTI